MGKACARRAGQGPNRPSGPQRAGAATLVSGEAQSVSASLSIAPS